MFKLGVGSGSSEGLVAVVVIAPVLVWQSVQRELLVVTWSIERTVPLGLTGGRNSVSFPAVIAVLQAVEW